MCVTPACLYGLETMALIEQQQQKLQICKNNWVLIITGAKRADRRKVGDLMEYIGLV